MKYFSYMILGLGLLGLGLTTSRDARAEGGLQIGVLACEAIPGTRINLLIHSSVDLKCIFRGPNGSERYKGETGIALGADLNLKGVERINFAVLAATSDYKMGSHSLSGRYGGAKASASLGIGVGAAVLVGGGKNNFSLQPVALEGNTGLGAAGGLGFLYIEADK